MPVMNRIPASMTSRTRPQPTADASRLPRLPGIAACCLSPLTGLMNIKSQCTFVLDSGNRGQIPVSSNIRKNWDLTPVIIALNVELQDCYILTPTAPATNIPTNRNE